jgi:hypothetical protein
MIVLDRLARLDRLDRELESWLAFEAHSDVPLDLHPSIVERAQRGDREAYEQLARDAARRLFLVASRILRDNDA